MGVTTIDLLKSARALVEKGWTQGAYSRNAKGEDCEYGDTPTCWCTSGALQTARNSLRAETHVWEPAWEIMEFLVGTRISEWNDQPERTKEEVLAVFDMAIKSPWLHGKWKDRVSGLDSRIASDALYYGLAECERLRRQVEYYRNGRDSIDF